MMARPMAMRRKRGERAKVKWAGEWTFCAVQMLKALVERGEGGVM